MLTGLSCGKRKPPLPPKERVLQNVEITGFQRGNQVILSWKMPARNAPPRKCSQHLSCRYLSSRRTAFLAGYTIGRRVRITQHSRRNTQHPRFGFRSQGTSLHRHASVCRASRPTAIRDPICECVGSEGRVFKFLSARTGGASCGCPDFPLGERHAGCSPTRLGRSDGERRWINPRQSARL